MISFFSSLSRSGPRNLAAGMAISLTCGSLYVWSAFTLSLEELYGWSRSESSLVFTLMIVFFAGGMATGGFLAERFGPRRTAFCGGALMGLGFAGAALSVHYGLFCLCYGAVGGYGVGLTNVMPLAVCLRWYPERGGMISGLLTACMALGTFLLGTCLAGWIIARNGPVTALAVLGALILGVAPAASLALRLPAAVADQGAAALPGEPLARTVRSGRFWLLWSWAFCIQIGGLMVAGHIVPYAVEQGVNPQTAVYVMGLYALGNGAGRLAFGFVLDRFHSHVAMPAAALLMAAGLALLPILPRVGGGMGLGAAVLAVSLAFGGVIPQLSALTMRMFGPCHLGQNIGFTATGLMAGGLLGPYLGGLLRVGTGSYLPAMGIGVAAALIALGLARRLCRRNARLGLDM